MKYILYNIIPIYLIIISLWLPYTSQCPTGLYGDDCTCDSDLRSALPTVNVTCSNLVWHHFGDLVIGSTLTIGQANLLIHGNLIMLDSAITQFIVLNSTTTTNTTGLNLTALNATNNNTGGAVLLHYGSINVTGSLEVNGIIEVQLSQIVGDRTYYSFFSAPNINISQSITPVIVDLFPPFDCEHSNVINRLQDNSLQLGIIQWKHCDSWPLVITVGITGFGAGMLLCAPFIVIVFWYHRSTFRPVGYGFHTPREYKKI